MSKVGETVMKFFDCMDAMKKDSSIKVRRDSWLPHHYIYWNTLTQVFCERHGTIEHEWAEDFESFAEDLKAEDWVRV